MWSTTAKNNKQKLLESLLNKNKGKESLNTIMCISCMFPEILESYNHIKGRETAQESFNADKTGALHSSEVHTEHGVPLWMHVLELSWAKEGRELMSEGWYWQNSDLMWGRASVCQLSDVHLTAPGNDRSRQNGFWAALGRKQYNSWAGWWCSVLHMLNYDNTLNACCCLILVWRPEECFNCVCRLWLRVAHGGVVPPLSKYFLQLQSTVITLIFTIN